MSRQNRGTTADSSPETGGWNAPKILLAIALVASPMVVGGVHAATAAAVAAVAAAGLWLAVASPGTENETDSFYLSIPAIGASMMALVCLVQLIPLPTAVFRLVQPAGYAAFDSSWEVAFGSDTAPGWHLLSMDPRATAGYGLRWTALALVSLLAAEVIRGREGRRRWLGVILFVGAVVACLGAAQQITGADKILWIYEADVSPRSISPFVNTNHAAVFFALMAIVAITFSLDHLRRSPPKTILGATAAVGAVFLCATHGSDGALLGLAFGAGTIGVALVTRANTEQTEGRRRLRIAAICAIGVVFAGAVAATMIPEDFTLAEEEGSVLDATSAEMRLHMTGAALDAAGDYPFAGSGAGSVERVLPPYLDWKQVGPRNISTIENEPVEWAMTMGPAVAVMALGLLVLFLVRTAPNVWQRRGRLGPSTAAAIAVFVAAISVFHFPFMTMGIAVVALVALEACTDVRRDAVYWQGTKKRGIFLLAALTLVLAGFVGARATVFDAGTERSLQVDDDAELRRAVHLHPTDGMLLSAMSLQARADEKYDDALRLAERAFELRPHPQQQFLLARTLVLVDDREASADVYADLLDRDRRRGVPFAWINPLILADLPTADLRARALHNASPGTLRRIASEIEDRQGILAAVELSLALVERRPDRADVQLRLIDQYRSAGEVELAEMYARMLVSRDLVGPDGNRPAGLMELLDLLRREGRGSEARHIAARAFDTGYGSPQLGRFVLRLLPGDPAEFDTDHREMFDHAFEVGCVPPYEPGHRRRCWSAEALFAELDGDTDEAAKLYRRIEHVHGDPRPLGRFLIRTQRCRELSMLQRRWRGDDHHERLERYVDRCIERRKQLE